MYELTAIGDNGKELLKLGVDVDTIKKSLPTDLSNQILQQAYEGLFKQMLNLQNSNVPKINSWKIESKNK